MKTKSSVGIGVIDYLWGVTKSHKESVSFISATPIELEFLPDWLSELHQYKFVWFLLQFSIGIWALISPLAGQILLGLTILLIIITAGPLGVLGMTGFMGDIISYSRLFALALSTAGICMTINLLADLVGGIPKIGIFLTIIIFVGGNIFGLIMNTLGAFVHSIRLQFVEFFGKFYEGGGDKFSPYKQNRVYTQEEEK